jgi:outer membrane protein
MKSVNALCALMTLAASFAVAQPAHLTLDAAVSEALSNNRTYRVSDIDARTAAGQVSWGRAGALPKVDVTASQVRSINATRQEPINTASATVENPSAKTTATGAGINGNWTVFEGLSSLAAHDRLSAQASLAGERRNQVRQDLAAQAILAYVDVVRQQTVLDALDSAVAFSRERVKITEGKYGFGSVSKLEMLQAKLDLNEDLSARLKQVAALTGSKLNLNRVLARDDTSIFVVDDSIPLAPIPEYQGLRNAALENSPDLRQAAEGKNLASAGFREYRGHLFPAVGLSLGYNYALTDAQTGLYATNQAYGLSYGVNVKWNVFDGFVLPSDYKAARASERRADILYQDAKDELESSLAQARENQRASREVLALEESNLGVAKENVGIAMQQLRLGTIASLELRASQVKFLDAETRLVSARFESKRAETELLRLAGRLAP